jgi:hypothetical protein
VESEPGCGFKGLSNSNGTPRSVLPGKKRLPASQ